MIETFPLDGIRPPDVTGAHLVALAALPVIIWEANRGYWRSGLAGYTPSPELAGRYTFADAYLQTRGVAARSPDRIFLQPIDFIRLDLPLPPSTNNLFVETKTLGGRVKRVKTKAYRSWLEHAGWSLPGALRAAGAPVNPTTAIFDKHWAIWIRLNIDHGSDVTNRIKAVEDFLVARTVCVGDQWNDHCTVERDRSIDCACRIVIYRRVDYGD